MFSSKNEKIFWQDLDLRFEYFLDFQQCSTRLFPRKRRTVDRGAPVSKHVSQSVRPSVNWSVIHPACQIINVTQKRKTTKQTNKPDVEICTQKIRQPNQEMTLAQTLISNFQNCLIPLSKDEQSCQYISESGGWNQSFKQRLMRGHGISQLAQDTQQKDALENCQIPVSIGDQLSERIFS